MKKDKDKKICFVISPIGKEGSPERARFDEVFEEIITPAVEKFGYEPISSEKVTNPNIITNDIIQHLYNDPLVVADLTGHNPNVFYELAIRHATRKPTVQIIQDGEKIPFDLSPQRTIFYDRGIKKAKKAIKDIED